jgi:lactam utilization protein B
MRTMRWVAFVASILLGIAISLIIGWMVIPPAADQVSPAALRADYKTDYVLMAAEAYQRDGDIVAAARRLALLSDEAPIYQVQQAIVYAGQLGYTRQDVDWLAALAQALEAWAPLPGGSTP